MTKEEIAKILKQLRLDAGFTQTEAAKRIGRKQQTLASWETGQSQPDANTLFVLCRIYDTTVDKAFGFEDENNITRYELALIEKYRKLDIHGKELVTLLLEKELQRCTASSSSSVQADISKECAVIDQERSKIEEAE